MTTRSDDDNSHWALDKRLNIGHLLTTLSLAAALFAWASSMDRRIAVLETQQQAQIERDRQQDSALASTVVLLRNDYTGLREELRETNRKLDRLAEYLSQQTRNKQ